MNIQDIKYIEKRLKEIYVNDLKKVNGDENK